MATVRGAIVPRPAGWRALRRNSVTGDPRSVCICSRSQRADMMRSGGVKLRVASGMRDAFDTSLQSFGTPEE